MENNADKKICRKRQKDENFIDLNFEVSIEELREVLLLGGIMGKILQEDDLPETKEFDVFTDFLFFSKRISDTVPLDVILKKDDDEPGPEVWQLNVRVTKREIKAALEVCQQGMNIIPRDENLTDKDANSAIALESFQRKLMKAAGIKGKGKKAKKESKKRQRHYEDNETLWQNIGQTLNRRESDEVEKFIELNFEARTDELTEILSLATIMAMTLNIFEMPDTDEFDMFTDYLLFSKRIIEAVKIEDGEEEPETVQVSVMATEREIKSVSEMLSHAMRLAAREKKMTDNQANSAILMESIRRRILKAAGMTT